MPDSTALNETNFARVDARDQARQRRLAGAGRAPEDDRAQPVMVDGLAQRPAGSRERFLADELVQRARPHPLGERRRPIGLVGLLGRRPDRRTATSVTLPLA